MATDLPIPDPDKLAEWLKDLRARAGLTQGELAEATGAKVRSIQRWEGERGRTTPGGDDLLRLFSALGVEVKGLAPGAVPAAVNAEIAALRQAIEQMLAMLEARPQVVGEPLLRLLAEDPAAVPPERVREVAAAHRRAASEFLLTADRLDELADQQSAGQEDQGV